MAKRTQTLRKSMLKAGEAFQAKRKAILEKPPKKESKRAADQRRAIENRLALRRLRQEARLQGHRLTKGDIIAAGIRPRRTDKVDEWKKLTPIEQELILARSKKHFENQLLIGIKLEHIYGPWTVMHHGARWDDKLSHATLAD